MKNNTTILKALTGILFVSVLTVGAFTLAPVAHAEEWDGGDFTGGCCGDMGSYSTGVDYTSQPTYDTTSYDQGSYSTGVDYYSEPTYDNSGYDTSGYSTGGYSTGGYSTGGYNYGTPYYSYSTPSYHAPAPVYTTPSYTNTNTNTNININTTDNSSYCTINSCNHDDHSVVNIQNPAPVINNVVANYGGSVANTQYCAQGYTGTYPNCYLIQQPPVYQQPAYYPRAPIAYNASTPYVSLSQVPYTGLDLGFWGTVAYWGAFVLFALFVAYLIAIKRVQNTIALKLKHFLFGTSETEEDAVVVVAHAPAQVAHAAPAAAASSEDVIDSFIMSQISRPSRA